MKCDTCLWVNVYNNKYFCKYDIDNAEECTQYEEYIDDYEQSHKSCK